MVARVIPARARLRQPVPTKTRPLVVLDVNRG